MITPRTAVLILDDLLAGTPAEDLQLDILKLSAVEHGALVCTACSIEHELAENCIERRDEVRKFVEANCSFHSERGKTCPRSQLIGLTVLYRDVP